MDIGTQGGAPAPAELAWVRGMDAYTVGAYPQAEEEFKDAVRIDPGMADAWLGLHALRVDTTTALLRMYGSRHRFGEQRARHRRTLNSWYWLGWWVQPVLESPRDLLLAHASHWLDGRHVAELDRALAGLPPVDTDPQVRFLYACRAYLVKDWDQLVRLTEPLVNDPLLGIEAGLFGGMARVRLEMYGQAGPMLAAALMRCRSEQPQRKELRYWLARAHEGTGRSAAALPLYRAVHRVDPAFMDTSARLAAIADCTDYAEYADCDDYADRTDYAEYADYADVADYDGAGPADDWGGPEGWEGAGEAAGLAPVSLTGLGQDAGGGPRDGEGPAEGAEPPPGDALRRGDRAGGPGSWQFPGPAVPGPGPRPAGTGAPGGSVPGGTATGAPPDGPEGTGAADGAGTGGTGPGVPGPGGPGVAGPEGPGGGAGPGPVPEPGPGYGARVRAPLPGRSAPPVFPAGPTDPALLAEALAELERMVGLDPVKRQVRALSAQLEMARLRAGQGLPVQPPKRHFVFSGPSGTGKTTVARILGRVFYALGLLGGDHLVEAQRSDLVGEFLGQTAVKANELIDSALGGVLFVDEAYALSNSGYSKGDAYGDEALQVLLKRAEDNRDQLVVILAGYPEGMDRLLAANPGLSSRFTSRVDFPSYRPLELTAIGKVLAAAHGDLWDEEAVEELRAISGHVVAQGWIDELGNGRFLRTLYEKSCAYRDLRLSGYAGTPGRTDLATLRLPDLMQAYGEVLSGRGPGPRGPQEPLGF
ncbi:AAA family ATPase [Streptomyces sp. LP05-1]|uniref:AAA family ATPase n=1 Tax=Streptomyces pyxinae TaxID=2970734 RepID=A0ABT2CQ16_9ACTN|nr:AAA family ATPase [Streptomyces sp. LP05-1]MCS0639536.1 AAA family ATPase [Streptomyces sp. LP05-1]